MIVQMPPRTFPESIRSQTRVTRSNIKQLRSSSAIIPLRPLNLPMLRAQGIRAKMADEGNVVLLHRLGREARLVLCAESDKGIAGVEKLGSTIFQLDWSKSSRFGAFNTRLSATKPILSRQEHLVQNLGGCCNLRV